MYSSMTCNLYGFVWLMRAENDFQTLLLYLFVNILVRGIREIQLEKQFCAGRCVNSKNNLVTQGDKYIEDLSIYKNAAVVRVVSNAVLISIG